MHCDCLVLRCIVLCCIGLYCIVLCCVMLCYLVSSCLTNLSYFVFCDSLSSYLLYGQTFLILSFVWSNFSCLAVICLNEVGAVSFILNVDDGTEEAQVRTSSSWRYFTSLISSETEALSLVLVNDKWTVQGNADIPPMLTGFQ